MRIRVKENASSRKSFVLKVACGGRCEGQCEARPSIFGCEWSDVLAAAVSFFRFPTCQMVQDMCK